MGKKGFKNLRIIFFILSIFYIAAIFLFAESRVPSDLAPFNPYSVLHIPLYGILTVLLIFSFVPIDLNRIRASTSPRINFKSNVPNVPNDLNGLNGPNDLNELIGPNVSIPIRLFISGAISLIVAISDEIHQSFIPTRDASITDVFLDLVGIILALFLISKYKNEKC